MSETEGKSEIHDTTRRRLRVSALVVLWGSMALLAAYGIVERGLSVRSEPEARSVVEIPEPTDVASSTALVLNASEPVRIRVIAAGIDAPFEGPLGLDETGGPAVPESYTAVGWYRYGPTPGERGPAVVLGHVDSADGPAVFYSLGQVHEGDTVEIARTDGSTAVFTVFGLERVEQGAFPIERVFASLPYAGIRLITCTGTYDKGVKRYSHNLIVYGALSDVRTTQ